MQKKSNFSILVFSRNDINELLETLADVEGISNDVVIIDSSDTAQRKKLDAYIKSKATKNIRVYGTIALGLAEIMRCYGYSKCKYDWVLQLDTDERISNELKMDIPKIIKTANCSAFAIKRYEDRKKGTASPFFTWQLRLYNKAKIQYLGKLHEQPLINGRINHLDLSKYYLLHLEGNTRDYNKLEKFQRLTYGTLKMRLLDETSKFLMPAVRKKNSPLSELLIRCFEVSRYLHAKKEHDEITNSDYYFYYIMKYGIYHLKQRRFNPIPLLKNVSDMVSRIRKWRSEPDSEIGLRLSTIIEQEGMVKYLGLDNPKNMDALTKKYANFNIKGTDLLIYLLIKRYKEGKLNYA